MQHRDNLLEEASEDTLAMSCFGRLEWGLSIPMSDRTYDTQEKTAGGVVNTMLESESAFVEG